MKDEELLPVVGLTLVAALALGFVEAIWGERRQEGGKCGWADLA
jgi:hypothetical protein